MTVALRDDNSVPTLLAVLNTDTVQGTNLVRIKVNPIDHRILADTTSTISFTMVPLDPKDANSSEVWAFEGTDHKLYPCVATSLGALLINTN